MEIFGKNTVHPFKPSPSGDVNKLDLNKKMNEKNKEIDKTLRQISRSYEDRCVQRQKMKSTLSLVKEIPKMEFDSNNKLVAREATTKLADVKKSKNGSNTIKIDDLEIEVTDEIMAMIYHKGLKKRMDQKSAKQRCQERRRSRSKAIEKSFDSSSDAEIGEFMKTDLFKQKVSQHQPQVNRETMMKTLQRYSPRLTNPLLPVIETESRETPENDQKIQPKKPTNVQISEFKFLSTDEPVPSPAPETEKTNVLGNKARTILTKTESFRKTKSSGALVQKTRVDTVKRNTSDPTSTFEEDNIDEDKHGSKKHMNISKTAKKHLGMAVTPIKDVGDHGKHLPNFDHTIRISSDETPNLLDLRKNKKEVNEDEDEHDIQKFGFNS